MAELEFNLDKCTNVLTFHLDGGEATIQQSYHSLVEVSYRPEGRGKYIRVIVRDLEAALSTLKSWSEHYEEERELC